MYEYIYICVYRYACIHACIRGLLRKYRDWIYYVKTYIHTQALRKCFSKYAPLTVTHLAQRCFQSSKHFWNSDLGMACSCCVEFCFIVYMSWNQCPFKVFLILGKRKKSGCDMSGELGRCAAWIVPCFVRNCCTRLLVWARTPSWWSIQQEDAHNTGRFLRTASLNLRMTSK